MQNSTINKRNIIIVNIFVPFLVGIGIDLVAPSLPYITHYFQAPSSQVQLIIALYMLGYGLGQIFLGTLSDSIGRKKILLISTFFYICISFAAIFSNNIYTLILMRFLQGLCIAGLGVVSRAIATDCFTGLDLHKAMNYIAISWSLGPVLGPFIGGYLQHYFSWQADFYFFALYGTFIFIYAALVIPETNTHLQPLNPRKVYHMLKNVITNPIFLLATAICSFFYAMLVIFNVIGPFLIQIDLQYSVVAYGHIALLLGLGIFLGNWCNRLLLNYLDPMQITFGGIIAAVLEVIIMLFLGVFMHLNLCIVFIPIFLIFFNCGLIFPNMMSKAIGLFPKTAGTSSALFGSLMALGVFTLSTSATSLKTNTQIPMAIMYLGLCLLCLLLFILLRRPVKDLINIPPL